MKATQLLFCFHIIFPEILCVSDPERESNTNTVENISLEKWLIMKKAATNTILWKYKETKCNFHSHHFTPKCIYFYMNS